jgi:hypothetical protein
MDEQKILTYYFKTIQALLKAKNENDAFNIFRLENLICLHTDHNNWNGSIDYYQIEILISPVRYAEMEKEGSIEKTESVISSAFDSATKGDESIVFTGIIIRPSSTVEDDVREAETGIDFSFWDFGYYNVFISHLTKDKTSASNLKTALSDYGISCFVAHEDIEPTKLWTEEIENALKTMHCLCAIITPDFINSKWCDQEVGYALGRRVLVIPIRKDSDPYGLIGKIQGIQSKGKGANKLAEEIFHILCSNNLSKRNYIRILAELLLNSKNNIEANKWIKLLNSISVVDYEIVEFVYSNYLANDNLKEETTLKMANEFFAKYSLEPLKKEKAIVSGKIDTDYLPF